MPHRVRHCPEEKFCVYGRRLKSRPGLEDSEAGRLQIRIGRVVLLIAEKSRRGCSGRHCGFVQAAYKHGPDPPVELGSQAPRTNDSQRRPNGVAQQTLDEMIYVGDLEQAAREVVNRSE